MIILIKLVAAHLIGDFMLQSDKLCRQKQSKSITKRLWVIAVHSFVQAILSYLFVGLWNCILLPLFVFITHYVIDLIKVQTGRNGLVTFIIDQLAHYVALCIIWWVMFVNSGSICGYASTCLLPISIWIVVTSYIALLAPTSILIKKFLEYNKWLPENPMQGLPNAGKWIGYLERVLILTFILTDNVEGVGFLWRLNPFSVSVS